LTFWLSLEVSFGFKTDVFFAKVWGGYQTYELESAVAGGVDGDDIDSLLYGVGAGVNFGPVFIKASVHGGENLGDYGAYNPHGNIAGATEGASPGKVEDNDALGYLAVFGFKAGDSATIEAGYGFQEYDSNIAGSQADEICQYYVNATINIAPGFFIVPEIGKYDRKESATKGTDQGDVIYYGAKWQINF